VAVDPAAATRGAIIPVSSVLTTKTEIRGCGSIVQTERRGDLSIADLFGNGAGGVTDNTLANGERIVSITLGASLPRERAIYRRAISQASAEWPLVEVAVRVVIDNAQLQFVEVTAGGIAPVPLRF
jgi:xanthine dehydrogenase YagS FAD-binding subunit